MTSQLCVALDYPDPRQIVAAARLFAGRAPWLKVGLEGFVAGGPAVVGEVAATGARVFLDVKLHDIPRTAGAAVAAAVRSGAAMINVHAFGGREMLRAAAAARGPDTTMKIVAVTLLTSLDARALSDLPIAGHPEGIVRRLALLARECGMDGVVCAAPDLPVVRACCGKAFFTVVPGIRPAGGLAADQRRVATPAEAARAGADLIVVGRPVTGAPDPLAALEALTAEIESAA